MKFKKYAALAVSLVIAIGVLAAFAAPTAVAETLPTVYPSNSDELPYSTAAKNQNPHGTCWAFAAVACAEADAIKNHGADKNSIDLSEWHLSYFAYAGERIGGDKLSYSGSTPYYMIGGYEMLAALTLSAGIGFADESVAPYKELIWRSQNGGDTSLPNHLMYECEYMLNNVIFLDIENDPDSIKRAVAEYGAVAVNYHSNTKYLNYTGYYETSTYAQYCPDTSKEADHAVTIVGWDDNYSRYKFSTDYGRPKRDGAWRVKNSWGEEFGYDGYFWISYEDVTLTGGTVYDVVPAYTYDRIYQHDGGISLQYVKSEKNDEIVNIFTAEGSEEELLSAVGVTTITENGTGEYELRIYGGVEYNDTDGLTYKRILHTQSGYLHYGYNTVILNKPVELKKGERFAVSFRADTYIMVDGDISTPLPNGSAHISDTVTDPGQTVYKEGSEKWQDAAYDTSAWNARIKAFTCDVSGRETTYIQLLPNIDPIPYGESLGSAEIYGGAVLDRHGNLIDGTWGFEDESITVDGITRAKLIFTPYDLSNYTSVSTYVDVYVDEGKTATPSVPDDGAFEENGEFEETPMPEDEWDTTDIGGFDDSYETEVSVTPDIFILIAAIAFLIAVVAVAIVGAAVIAIIAIAVTAAVIALPILVIAVPVVAVAATVTAIVIYVIRKKRKT